MSAKTYTTQGIYQVRKNGPDGAAYYTIGIPRSFGEQIAGKRFKFTMTDQGLLFVPVDEQGTPTVELPEWAVRS